jgi:hypothetical protein
MRALGSVILACAGAHRVPAGSALAVDRERFASAVKRDVAALVAVRGSVSSMLSSGVKRGAANSSMPREFEMRKTERVRDCGIRNDREGLRPRAEMGRGDRKYRMAVKFCLTDVAKSDTRGPVATFVTLLF